jgi:hypothetical protein
MYLQTRGTLHLDIVLYGVETWALWKVYQKYLESSKYGAGEGWKRSD